jgi:hypothetical protein
MGILRATLPDGAEIEHRISRHEVYSYGLVANRDGRWVLISVHKTSKAAGQKCKRMAGFYKPDKSFCAMESLKVIAVKPVLED